MHNISMHIYNIPADVWNYLSTWAVSKRSCSSEGDKDMLTRQLALCLRHHRFGLREGFCLIALTRSLRLQAFAPGHRASLRAAIFLKQNAILFYQLFEFNCQAGRRSRFLVRVVRKSNCSGMQYALWSRERAKCLRTLPAQCIGCGHEHQNPSKSKNYQSAPLECRLPLTHKRNVGLRVPYARLTQSLRGCPGSKSWTFI